MEPPADLSKYYPSEYYSYDWKAVKEGYATRLKRAFRRLRVLSVLEDPSTLGKIANLVRPAPKQIECLKGLGISRDDFILDVGCGVGAIVNELANAGFKHVRGIDPYLSKPILYDTGAAVETAELNELPRREEWDVIMMSHVLEHLPRQHERFEEVRLRLRINGLFIVRVPLVDSAAWEKYGVHWVQLDAPRHFFLHTRKSLAILSSKHGFALQSVRYDSDAFQFWGSEQYLNGIPLMHHQSYARSPRQSPFSAGQIADFSRRALELNAQGLGDQASFAFRRIN
jgi:SAM-dependent methyltransferase